MLRSRADLPKIDLSAVSADHFGARRLPLRGFTTSQIRAALLLCVLAAAGWGIRYHLAGRHQAGEMPFDPYPADTASMAALDSIRAALDAPVDVNTAGAAELQRLRGIGPELASRVLEERSRGGEFRDIDELAVRVHGIGRATAERLRGRVTFGSLKSTARDTSR